MITFSHKGDFKITTNFFKRVQQNIARVNWDKYGRDGVKALSEQTPKDTGLTASSWSYNVVKNQNSVSIQFLNSNVQNGILVAVLIQYGHLTRNGAWIEGIDYINPSIKPVFEQMTREIWGEVTAS